MYPYDPIHPRIYRSFKIAHQPRTIYIYMLFVRSIYYLWRDVIERRYLCNIFLHLLHPSPRMTVESVGKSGLLTSEQHVDWPQWLSILVWWYSSFSIKRLWSLPDKILKLLNKPYWKINFFHLFFSLLS